MRTVLLFISAFLSFAAANVANASDTAAKSPPKEFIDCADCPPMVVVPAGKFMMGLAPEKEPV